MNNSKTTKRAWLTSALSVLACVAMLIGTTFAWFTDTAKTNVNKIQSGTLDVALEMLTKNEAGEDVWVNAENQTLDFKKAEGGAGEKILWEPGCTYELPKLRVVNNGNLALKYKVQITGIKGDAELNKVIDWTIGDVALGTEQHLKPEASNEFTIKGHMQETAGNTYQNKSIDGIAITVYATQDTVEHDSNGNQYDKDATYYPVIDYAGLKDALAVGGDVTVSENITADATKTGAADRLQIKKPTNLTFDGMYTVPGELEDSNNWAALYISADTTINASDKGGIDCLNKTDPNASYIGGPYVAHITGGTVTVNGGNYYGGGTTFQVQQGTLIVNGGFFKVAPDIDTHDYRYVLNCVDASYKNGSAKIIVKGGTFVNFDPSNNGAEGAGTNFVADGYSVISETKSNGEVWYTVVKGTGVVASTQDDLNNGIANNTTATVKLDKGTYTLPALNSKDITITGTKDTVIDMKSKTNNGAQNVAFEGVTVEFSNESYKGFQHTGKLTYKDCTITGTQVLYATDAEFVNCTFKQETSDKYNAQVYGSTNVTFTNCHFYGTNKHVYIYQETLDSDKNVTFNNCDFHMSATKDLKSAVMLNAPLNYAGYKYNVAINSCTAEGANTTAAANEAGNTNYQGLYGLKHKDGNGNGKIIEGTVTVDGTVVYSK